MKRLFIFGLLIVALPCCIFAQHSADLSNRSQIAVLQDSLKRLGDAFVNAEIDVDRIAASATFTKTLVTALKTPNSFLFPFDSLKTISILNSPDNRFRIFSWHIMYIDGSYRFYGAIQMNTGGALKLYPLQDYSPILKNPEDSVTDNKKWYGAQYYKIVRVDGANPYYVVLGWKGNTAESTKKVIDVISFKNNDLQLGLPVFDQKGKTKKRIVFEYNRGISMLLHYVPEQNLIVFDHLSPSDPKFKNDHKMYGPDFTYDGYRLKNGRWEYVDNIDMRNVPNEHDAEYIDPKADRANTEKPLKIIKKPL